MLQNLPNTLRHNAKPLTSWVRPAVKKQSIVDPDICCRFASAKPGWLPRRLPGYDQLSQVCTPASNINLRSLFTHAIWAKLMRRATALAICAQSPCMPARTNTDAWTVRKHNASGHYVVVGGGIKITSLQDYTNFLEFLVYFSTGWQPCYNSSSSSSSNNTTAAAAAAATTTTSCTTTRNCTSNNIIHISVPAARPLISTSLW